MSAFFTLLDTSRQIAISESDMGKRKARNARNIVFGVNNVKIVDPEFHVITFSKAVRRKPLVDYEVILLAVDGGIVSASFNNS